MGKRGRAATMACIMAGAAAFAGASIAQAGGGAENAVVIIDPASPESRYLGHLYQAARGIPDRNVLYMPPAAADYPAWSAFQRPALDGALAARGIADHVDFVVVAPGGPFQMPMRELVTTPCIVVSRISASSAYTFAPIADEVLAGGMFDQTPNRYYRGIFDSPDNELAFDSEIAWYQGSPSRAVGARRYFIGFMLGYTGERGNSVAEIAQMIDRGARADGMRPEGTFYFMTTADAVRSYRRTRFPATIDAIRALGGRAEALDGTLPLGRHDALGILTGITDPAVAGADVTLLPGAFADHLTSYAATFDSGSQGKMSQWIAAGAGGSLGTVEEPCTGGKFPDPELHARYFAGMSLGEAVFRSVPWTAFQSLFYGDPLTQPFAYLPTVAVDDVPAKVSGTFRFSPRATSTRPGGKIREIDVLIDGVRVATGAPGWVFDIDTTALDDGHHDLRVLAREDHAIRTQGRWRGTVVVDNHGRSVNLSVDPPSGDRDTLFTVRAAAIAETSGSRAQAIRLLQNGRVIAAVSAPTLTLRVSGDHLGAGPLRLQSVADYSDRRSAVSLPVDVDIALTGGAPRPAGLQPPIAFGYTLDVPLHSSMLLDLPAVDDDGDPVTVEVVGGPTHAKLIQQGAAWLLLPPEVAPAAPMSDAVTFVAQDSGARKSAPATVTVRYCPPDDRVDDRGMRFCRAAAAWLPWASGGR